MAFSKSDKNREIIQIALFFIYGLIIAIGIPSLVGFALGGFELQSIIQQFTLYYGLIFAGLLGVTAFKIIEIMKPDGSFRAIIHDPKTGILFNTKGFKWVGSVKRVILISLLFFTIISIGSLLTNTFFVGTPNVIMQVTETAKILFTVEPPTFAETVFFLFILAIFLTLTKFMQKKFQWKDSQRKIVDSIVIPSIMGFLWVSYHILRYGGQEQKLLFVFLFGFFGSMITILTGTFILWLIWHDINNLISKVHELFSNEIVFIFIGIILALIFFITIFYFRLKSVKKNKDINY